MKKGRILISIFIFMLIISSNIFAESNEIAININGLKTKAYETTIWIDGQAMKSNIPSFISTDGRTFVPLRFLEENLGAKIGWIQETKTATVEHGDISLSLTIDSLIVSLNNVDKILGKDSIPRLVTFSNDDSRTMVPFAFIGEVLGYDYGWDEENRVPFINTKPEPEEPEEPEIPEEPIVPEKPEIPKENTVTDILAGKGSTKSEKVIIHSKDTIKYDFQSSSDSQNIVIDIYDAKLDLPKTGNRTGTIKDTNNNFSEIHYSQYKENPYITRVTIKRKSSMDYDIVTTKDGKSIIVSFVHKIEDIKLEKVDNKEAIVIKGTNGADFNVMKLHSPERIVIDIMDSSLANGTYFDFDYVLGFVKGVRVSQFQADNNYSSRDRIVRVVLDVRDGILDPNIKIDTYDDKLVLYPEKNVWENMIYEGEDAERFLTINNLSKTDYKIHFDPVFKKMEITIPTKAVDLNSGVVVIQDRLVDEIEIQEGPIETTISLRFRRSIEYKVLSNTIDDKVLIELKRDSNITPGSRLIVIDPGHGGSQTGASSPNGVREKDINLEVSLKVEKALRDLGYNVVMTRDTDKYVDNYDRPKIANEANADLFLSIHANSTTSNSIHGIEVLYCPRGRGQGKEEDQYPFAKSLLDELIKATGAHNRGVIQRPELIVIRDSNMPAALVEIGFLSNAAEEKKITSDSYQNKLVNGIVKGIEEYFNLY